MSHLYSHRLRFLARKAKSLESIFESTTIQQRAKPKNTCLVSRGYAIFAPKNEFSFVYPSHELIDEHLSLLASKHSNNEDSTDDKSFNHLKLFFSLGFSILLCSSDYSMQGK